ncbi:6-carboxytetrahydropterin synthase [Olsenella sp. Marseille-P4559]|uniref:6-pyruvoyl trahydropterin synthase family protein n=1 Tax=Olsenella sp. Marseille-P4559 TaxID=2364795 RepID=UPI001031C9BB|nr:6-carboxytetrahydropterin synthase [Olsenella sp. Marseille-P4559]
MYELSTEYWFDSAHFLTGYNGKCENLHGHQWRVTAYVRSRELGASGTERDMIVDFVAFKRIVREECDALDHTFLVEEGSLKPATLEALESEGFSLTILPFRTTAENLAHYLFDRLVARGLPVGRVDCNETPNNRASYAPDQG